ncbi:MAG: methionyl-tRNA formyltransferase [Blautia sp.]|nr:methionyl-tRNA formyltransferase [Blautia sp.]
MKEINDRRLIYMGTPDFAVPALKALIEAGYTVSAVVTQPDRPKGRSGALVPPPVKTAAEEAGIPVWQPEKVKDPAFLARLAQAQPDLIVVAAYGRILPEAILKTPPFGCINIHASLLPAYRGAAPIQHAVINGDKESGVTIMQMDAGLDTGDILARTVIPLAEDETGGSLFDKLADAGAQLLIRTIPDLFEGRLTPEKQPAESTTPYAAMITKQMGELDFSLPALSLERLIRGLDPWPCAYTFLDGRSLKIWKAGVLPDDPDAGAVPGTVLSADREGIRVACGKGCLILTEVQLEGKKRMGADAFLRGYRIPAGTVLGKNIS